MHFVLFLSIRLNSTDYVYNFSKELNKQLSVKSKRTFTVKPFLLHIPVAFLSLSSVKPKNMFV